jgi:glutathione-regulated potassium-efflux system ancillary protein KefC/glutathione-regulated potassium-efflux system protein KefB
MSSLLDVVILLAAGVVAVSVFKRLGLGSVLGYLAAGVVIGPFGLRFITNVESIVHISELGVVLLLFLIGLELEPSRLWVLRRSVFGLGGAQVGFSTLALAVLARAAGIPWSSAVCIAFALSLSSTAFVMQILSERRETLHVYGRSSFAILLFQDLAVIPFLAVVPLIAGEGSIGLDAHTALAVGKAVGALAIVALVGAFVVRPAFRFIAGLRSQETFAAAALLTVIATALFVQAAGLSMSLGAFLAGVLLANSEHRHEIEADIHPFEGLLLGLFFIAVGMSANLGIVVERPLALVGVTLAVLAVKAAVLAAVGKFSGANTESTIRLALALPQGGEFAFVLFSVAVGKQILSKDLADFLVMVVTLSMALTPLGFALADRLAKRLAGPSSSLAYDSIAAGNHPVIIAGFGRYGQIIARMLRMRHITFVALEINQEQVDFVRKFGNKIYYGDASRLDLLTAASAETAKVFVLAIDDIETSMRTAMLVRHHFPHLKIIARARNRNHAYRLMNLGITSVHRELFAGSLEGAEAVLEALGDSPTLARRAGERFRKHDEASLMAGYAVQHDEQQLIAMSRSYAKELESIFDADIQDEARMTPPEAQKIGSESAQV